MISAILFKYALH